MVQINRSKTAAFALRLPNILAEAYNFHVSGYLSEAIPYIKNRSLGACALGFLDAWLLLEQCSDNKGLY
jgi:hypothetical protein